MFTQRFLISALVLAAVTAPAALASACTNPCTGSSATGSDSADRTNFNADNSDLAFSNIDFNSNATGTYDSSTTGLNSTNAPSASLFGTSYIGCLSSENPCASNSAGVIVGTIANWNSNTDPVLQVDSTNFGNTGSTWDTLTVTVPANTYAFGIDLIDQNGNGTGIPLFVHVDATADMSTTGSVALPGSVFFGFRSATPIGTVSVYTSLKSEQIDLDNFEIGQQQQAAATPEVATILLIGTGLVIIFYARKRRWLLSPQLA